MIASKQTSILLCFLLYALPSSANNIDNRIEELEKEKSDLYNKIKSALNDSIKILAETNDTEARVGLNLIAELGKQLDGNDSKEYYNETLIEETRRKGRKDSKKHNNHRRHAKMIEREGNKDGKVTHKKKDDDILVLDNLFEDKLLQKGGHKAHNRLQRRERMRKKVEEWLKKKELERKKIKQLVLNDLMAGNVEHCPFWGVDRKKKKNRFSGRVPCCRKCCKHSYLGCLRK